MKYNPAVVKSAKQEWSEWLEVPEASPTFTIPEMRKWVENRPPMNAFSSLIDAIEVMQDEIDLLHMKLREAKEELQEARRYLMKRF